MRIACAAAASRQSTYLTGTDVECKGVRKYVIVSNLCPSILILSMLLSVNWQFSAKYWYMIMSDFCPNKVRKQTRLLCKLIASQFSRMLQPKRDKKKNSIFKDQDKDIWVDFKLTWSWERKLSLRTTTLNNCWRICVTDNNIIAI